MPAGESEYAWPYMRPWFVAAAAFTAQWHAELTSHVRPWAMSSKAPLVMTGTSSVVWTDDVVRLLTEKAFVWNS
jgi:hypothetical protein